MRAVAGLARSLEGRTVAVLLLAVLLVHGGALSIYRRSAVAAADEAFATEVARQLVLAREAVLRRPPDARGTEAKALSSNHFEIGWDAQGPEHLAATTDPALRNLRDRLLSLEPILGPSLVLTLETPDEPLHRQDLRGTFLLPDGSALTFRSAHAPSLVQVAPWASLATAMAILVGGAAVVLMHRIAGPLRELTQATARIGHGTVVLVPEIGPDETRGIGRALNAMQERIHRLVEERTLAFAAVSHDLRTPIARLRLRLDRVEDVDERRAMAADLDEMQAMVEATLAYLRGDADPVTPQVTNVASVLIGIADASADAGRDVTYRGPGRALATVRPVTFRRALENLVDNGVRYGVRVRIALVIEAAALVVRIDDDGPGIAPEEVARAFEPFTRLEGSRNRNTGGTGLGLTIAKRAVEAEGGSLALSNRAEGGLRAEVRLSRTGPGT
ncbi:ATP-binding protein [Methylorubrum extorquens]|jgi:signal transduction histidine kinase|uniref:histidine kinase n=3 Tax=Methylorubrum extorquens TaxID=408 RepID=C5B3Q4_METEA|nr:ATP-binding protein [Methylorubrum extorquens]AWI87982.1 HAMP domain-containing protein [Methylobacterium sp. DM1]KQO80543.1 histidine kinase [Methylobacterium sp. Leaf90]ACK81969.1 histidine kinase [Methylorubrum extorquens CM4]ACS43086.1 Periplasmic sensor signal transduction histidine kinase [Methylorubrum extorquens AM1]MCP1545873.1 signal transduction histidine kinase [Methylorubrum extorquens]